MGKVAMVNENRFWNSFLLPYELAVSGFIIKIESIRKEFILKKISNPIESVTGRVKSVSSILEKAERLGIDFHKISDEIFDIAGIRIICRYIQDVKQVFELLKAREDIEIFLIKDYIENPKPSGYRSLHLVAKCKVETVNGRMPINIEFQIRTYAMHIWASIEHSLQYKYYRQIPDEIREKLIEASKITGLLDEEMAKIKQSTMDINVEKFRSEEYELENIGLFLDNINKR